MTKKAGTTAHWERPWRALFELRTKYIQQVDVLEVLAETKMTQSKAEGRRLLQQGRIWDCDVIEIDDNDKPIKVVTMLLPEERHVFAEPGVRWIVGKPAFVSTSRGAVLDLTQGKLVLFTLAPKNDPRCNSGVAARIVHWFLGGFCS